MLPAHLRQQVEISSASIRVCTAKAAHSDDEAKTLFGTRDVLTRDWTNTDRMISDRLQSYRVAYAYNGSLNAPGLPRWPSFNEAPTLRCIWATVRHAAIALQRFLKGEAQGRYARECRGACCI
jgi:hypothetical protein